MLDFSPHFCRGRLPVAFIFCVPGAEELLAGRPTSGVTGENFDFALRHLSTARPETFSSPRRYDYRITNSVATPMAISLGDTSSEPKKRQITAGPNVARVVNEVEGCSTVVLCGRKAQLLDVALAAVGRRILYACHVGNKALNRRYKVLATAATPSALSRRDERARLWAAELLSNLALHPVVSTMEGCGRVAK